MFLEACLSADMLGGRPLYLLGTQVHGCVQQGEGECVEQPASGSQAAKHICKVNVVIEE